jgi:hypothetical protein
MTKRTRYFLLGSAATLILGLCTGLVAYYGGFPTVAFSRPAGPEELQYVPDSAAVVAYANVRDVMSSQLRQRLKDYEPHQGHEREQEHFQRETGINIETDIDRVVACLSPGQAFPGQASSDSRALVLARGRFDEVRLEGLARQHGATVQEYRGKRLITHTNRDRDRTHSMALAFVARGLVAMGDDALVRQAIDLQQGAQTANITANAELMRMVNEMGDGSAWAVGRFDAISAQARLPQQVASQIPPITVFASNVHVNGGVSGTLRAETRDEPSAENLRDVIRGFMALAKMQAGSKPEMQGMLQSLELGGTGKTVYISFAVPLEALEMLAPRRQGNNPN